MPISLAPVESTNARLTAVATGTVTLDDLRIVATVLAGAEEPRLPLLLDLSEADTDMRGADVQRFAKDLAHQVPRTDRGSRVVLVAPSDVWFGVARMLIAYCELEGFRQVAAFRSRHDADSWLSVDSSRAG